MHLYAHSDCMMNYMVGAKFMPPTYKDFGELYLRFLLRYSQTTLYGHLLNMDTSLLRTVCFVHEKREHLDFLYLKFNPIKVAEHSFAAVSSNSLDGACFKLDKQTWRRKKQWYREDNFSKSTY